MAQLDQRTVIESRMDKTRIDNKSDDLLSKQVNEGVDYEESLEGQESANAKDKKLEQQLQEKTAQKQNAKSNSTDQGLAKKSVSSKSSPSEKGQVSSKNNTETRSATNDRQAGSTQTRSNPSVKNGRSVPGNAAAKTTPSSLGDIGSPLDMQKKGSGSIPRSNPNQSDPLNKSVTPRSNYGQGGSGVNKGTGGYGMDTRNGNYPQYNQTYQDTLKAAGYGKPSWNSNWMFNYGFNQSQDEKFFNSLSEQQKAKAEYFQTLKEQNKVLFLISIGETVLALRTLVGAHRKLMQEGTKMLAEKLNAVQRLRAETLIEMSYLEPPEADSFDMEDANDSAEFQSEMTEYDSSMRMLNNQVQGLGSSSQEITGSLQGLKKDLDNLEEFVKGLAEQEGRHNSYMSRWQ